MRNTCFAFAAARRAASRVSAITAKTGWPRPAVVVARDVTGGEYRDHAGFALDRVDIDREQAPMRHRRQAQCAVQGAGEFGQVVDIGRAAGHVQRR